MGLSSAATAFVVLLLGPGTAAAQAPIESTSALKQACAAGTHHVYVTSDINVTRGPHEDIPSGCQITLGPSASFAASGVSMRFTGPFRIDAARERSVTFTNSVWQAKSLGLYLGDAGTFRNIASRLRATGGGIELISGSDSTVALQQRPTGSRNSLQAAGLVSVFGGSNRSLILNDTAIVGGTGVRLDVGGTASVLKAERAEVTSPRGAVTVVGQGTKPVVELNGTTLASGGGNTNLSLLSPEARVTTDASRIRSATGSVYLRAGLTQGDLGGVEVVDTIVEAARAVRVEASVGRQFGTVKVAKSTISGDGDVILATGERGTTAVSESNIGSASAIRIFSGLGGTCTAEKNSYASPIRRICI